MTIGGQARDSLSQKPAEAAQQEVVYRHYVKRKIKEGIKAAEEGRVVSHDQVKRLFAR